MKITKRLKSIITASIFFFVFSLSVFSQNFTEPAIIHRPLKDYGLKDHVNVTKTLPHSENQEWRLVCKLPYNAQFQPWIEVEAPSGKVIKFDSTNPLVPAQFFTQQDTTVYGIKSYEAVKWISGEGAIYTVPAGVSVRAVKYRETGYDTKFVGSFMCNDNDYNILWKKASRTAYLCMREHYMDCPDRERSEWLGMLCLRWKKAFISSIIMQIH